MTGAIAIMRRNTTEALQRELGVAPQEIAVSLPWPPSSLNPNARPHYMAKASAAKRYKTACFYLLMVHRRHLKGKSEFTVRFRPPDKRGRDKDNLIGAFKNGQDALALVTGVNDKLFDIDHVVGSPIKGGAVEVTFAAVIVDVIEGRG